jgi:branched-chain amino acid aminotransferase
MPSPLAPRPSPLLYLNGSWLSREEAKISAFDQGFLYGDGVYEVIRVYRGKPFYLAEHLVRLWASAEAIGIRRGNVNVDLPSLCAEALRRNRLSDALLRIILTRGPGDETVYPGSGESPTLLVIPREFHDLPEEKYRKGIRAVVVSVRRNSALALPPRIKSITLLNNILAKREALERGADEPILLSPEGHLSESCASNVFFVTPGRVKTPDVSVGLLWGITRRVVIDIVKKLGLPLEEGFYAAEELLSAEEVFLTSTTREIMPVTLLDGKPVGDGKPGSISRNLLVEFRKFLSNH